MKTLSYLFTSTLVISCALGIQACQKQEPVTNEPGSAKSTPQEVPQGMRAYVDPVSGEYTTPPIIPDAKSTAPATAGTGATVPPDTRTPAEIKLPDGGVMMELGDQFQTDTRTEK